MYQGKVYKKSAFKVFFDVPLTFIPLILLGASIYERPLLLLSLIFVFYLLSLSDSALIIDQLYDTILTERKQRNTTMSFKEKLMEKLRFLRNIGTGGVLRSFLEA